MRPPFEENLWVIVQPAAGVPKQWRARCLNADIVSSSASPERALGALADTLTLCLEQGSYPRRSASRDEWALVQRVLRDGRAGPAPADAVITAAAQLEVVRSTLDGAPRVRKLPWVWLTRGALRPAPAAANWSFGPWLPRPVDGRASLSRALCGRFSPPWGKGTRVSNAPEIIVTTQDFERLQRLLCATGSSNAERLDAELARARLVAQTEVPEDVVTMNSDVTYEDASSGERRTVRLVYPKDAEPARGWVSVLAPIGSALLGLRQGQAIDWAVPRGRRRLRILDVPYQPERHGHFTL